MSDLILYITIKSTIRIIDSWRFQHLKFEVVN